MDKTQKLLCSYLFTHKIMVSIIFIILLFMNTPSFAKLANPGAVCTDGFYQDKLTDNDYTSLLTSSSNNQYFNVAGNASGSIPLQMKMSISESSANNTNDNFSIIGASQYKLINIGRNFPDQNAYTDITLSFRNNTTQQPINLTNVAISAFDIDYSNTNNSLFDDYVRITGVTQSGTIIDGTLQALSGSNVIYSGGLNNTNTFNCPSRDLDTRCQGSIQFSQPVNTVTVRYSNNPVYVKRNPSGQEIQIRLDNYCYAPKYIFSGTVFNDNGNVVNPNIEDISAKYMNNPDYFNGEFNPSVESGIPFTAGHTVTLNKCLGDTSSNPFTPQTMNIRADGTYSFNLTALQISSNTKLCVTQNEPSDYIYSVDTTGNMRQIDIVANKYSYPNNNFGDVLQQNTALVLVKSQYVHDCSLTDLTTIDVNYEGLPTVAFSKNSIDKIKPGQCIAYRIEAINRGNVPLTDIVIKDTLQEKGKNGALVTSTLANPPPIGENAGTPTFPTTSLAIGSNGIVMTNGFILGNSTSGRYKAIRFNTKYGSTSDK